MAAAVAEAVLVGVLFVVDAAATGAGDRPVTSFATATRPATTATATTTAVTTWVRCRRRAAVRARLAC
jgi:hypothetical protein